MRSSRVWKSVPALLLPAVAIVATGCGGGDYRISEFRSNPTPRLDTLGETRDDVANNLTITADTDFRSLNEDLGRMFHVNRPSRMTPHSVPY